jgi:hypothetical protein
MALSKKGLNQCILILMLIEKIKLKIIFELKKDEVKTVREHLIRELMSC